MKLTPQAIQHVSNSRKIIKKILGQMREILVRTEKTNNAKKCAMKFRNINI